MFRFPSLLLDTTKIIVGSQEDICYACLLQHIVQISRHMIRLIPFQLYCRYNLYSFSYVYAYIRFITAKSTEINP